MVDKTLVAMTSASALTGAELFYSVQGTSDVKVTSSQIYSYITTVSTLAGGGSSAAGVSGNIQYNNGGVFGAILNSSWDATNSFLTVQSNTLTLSSTGGAQKATLDGNGFFTVGPNPNFLSGLLELNGNPSFQTGNTQVSVGNSSLELGIFLAKTRGTVPSSHVIVQDSDRIGTISAIADDGVFYRSATKIRSEVDGIPGVGSMPGRLLLMTTPGGTTTSLERVRVDQGGRMVVGGAAAQGTFETGATTPALQVLGTDGNTGATGLARFSANAGTPKILTGKSRGATIGDYTIVSSGDTVAQFIFSGADGTAFRAAAQIRATIDGAPGANVMPGRLAFDTSPNGSATPTERMAIDNGGVVSVQNKVIIHESTPFDLDFTGSELQIDTAAFQWSISAIGTGNFQLSDGSIALAKTRGATAQTNVIVQSSDRLGSIWFYGNDGVQYQQGASIRTFVDAAPGVASMPTRMTFLTTTTGAISPTERMRMDSAGRVIVGGTASQNVLFGFGPLFQLHFTNTTPSQMGITNWGTGSGAEVYFGTSKSGTIGTHTIVANNDELVFLAFTGSDGVSFQNGAYIQSRVDGVPALNNVPARIMFGTAVAGGGAPTERVRIDNTGNTWLMNAPTVPTTPTGARGNVNGTVAEFAHTAYGGV